MRSKKFLKKYRVFILFLFLMLSPFFSLKEDLISDAITCISIVFAFSQSFLLATYSNKEINFYMKKHNMFEGFIQDNKKFLKLCLFSLIFLFFLSVFNFKYDYYDILHVSSIHFALLIIVFQLNYTLDFADNYMNVYKNSYNQKVLNEFEKDLFAGSEND
ncbi:MAG: hypothetical protein IJ752_06965 [Alphaproteobacteria bacterium]|nr:hypothetical protein [Alphaproteobacteria bacterium]